MTDETFMRRCIALAQNGRYHAAPNPMVGCCIVSGGRIIAAPVSECDGSEMRILN